MYIRQNSLDETALEEYMVHVLSMTRNVNQVM